MARIGVMPVPPARKRYRGASTSAKRLRGPRTAELPAGQRGVVDLPRPAPSIGLAKHPDPVAGEVPWITAQPVLANQPRGQQ